jgi:uncharacterized repeat protein (TIGR02543 family)
MAPPAGAQIISLNGTSSANSSGTGSFSWSHPLANGANRVLIIGVASADTSTLTCGAGTNQSVTSVTFNNVAATPVPGSIACAYSGSYVAQTELFYLTESAPLPAAGSYNVNVNFYGTPAGAEAGVIVLNGVAQNAPEAVAEYALGSSTTISTSITTLTNGAWVVDVFGNGRASSSSPGSSQTEQWYQKADAAGGGSTEAMPTAGTATFSWTASTAWPEAESVASFAPAPIYTLTSNVVPSGAGTVSVYPNQSSYVIGADVQLTATPASGFVFTGWSGNESGVADPTTITMNSNLSVTANFAPAFTVTTPVSPAAGGTVSVSPAGPYLSGAQVTLTATPAGGYVFSSWSGGASGAANPLIVTIGASNLSVTANFVPAFTITTSVNPAGGGSITANPPGPSYVSGTQVTLTAAPASGYQFSDWSGGAAGTANPVIVTVGAGNLVVTANFSALPNQCTLTTAVTGQGTVTPSGTVAYTCGSQVQVTASPATNWSFTSWSGNYIGTDNPTTITLNTSMSLTANFSQTSFPLNITTVGGGSVTTSPSASYYPLGTVVTLTPVPPADGYFVSWSGALTGAADPAQLTISGAANVTAIFGVLQITEDAVSSAASTNTTSALSWQHTLGVSSGTNRAVIIEVASADGSAAAPDPNAAATSVTFNGVYATPLPLCVNNGGSQSCSYGGGSGMVQTQMFYLLDSELPGPGTYTVAVNFAGTVSGAAAAAISFSGVSQGPPEQEFAEKVTSGAGKHFATKVTTQANNDWLIDVISDGTSGAILNPGSSQTIAWSLDASLGTYGGSTLSVSEAGTTVTMNWNPYGEIRLAHTVIVLSPASSTVPPTYTLNLAVSPADTGTVTLNPNLAAYPQGTAVLVTATPAYGSSFLGWSADLAATTNPYNQQANTATTNPLIFEVNSNYSSTASFSAVPMCTMNVTISPSGEGAVSPPSGSYPCGAPITLTAQGIPGYSLGQWTGDVDSADNPVTFTLSNDMNITANFIVTPMCNLTMNVVGQGTVTPASGSYPCGPVTLTAAAANAWQFSSWSGDYSGTANPATMNLSGNLTVTATFTQIPICSLTMDVVGQGTVTPGSGSYLCTTLTLSAAPAAGSYFSGWSGGYTGTDNPVAITLGPATQPITATFVNSPGDTRTVTEPAFPPVCSVLTAQQVAGSLNEIELDTARVQAALDDAAVPDACPNGAVVEFAASGGNNAFLIGPITLPAGVTMLVDAEVTIFGSINYADYDCSELNGYEWCNPLITVAPNTAPSPGSAIMGYGIIDGRGGWTINGLGKSWWALGGNARPRLVFMGSFVTDASADNFTLYKTTLQNSPMYHLSGFANNLIVWDAKVTAPSNSPNTDGMDPFGSNDLTITNSYIADGDDFISLKSGTVDANLALSSNPVTNVTVSNVHAYTGHGFSLGSPTSGGMSNITFSNIAIDDVSGSSAFSMRIKSAEDRGGLVQNVTYQNVCIKNGGDTLYIDPYYDSTPGALYPDFQNITLRNVYQSMAGGKSMIEGFNQSGVDDPVTLTLDNVVFNGYAGVGNLFENGSTSLVSNADITLGPGPVSFASFLQTLAANSSNNITLTDAPEQNNNAPYDCTNAFVYLAPELFTAAPGVAAGGSLTLTSILQPVIASETETGTVASAGPYATPTGTITIYDAGTPVATVPVAAAGASYTNFNQRSLTYIPIMNVAAGLHTYSAAYSGDSNYAPLNYGSVAVTAAVLSATAVTPVHAPAGPVYGQAITETTTVTPTSGSGMPTGKVTLTIDGAAGPVQEMSGGSAAQALSLQAGTHSISAAYSGDSQFAPGTGTDAITVVPAPLTVTCANQSIPYGAAIPSLPCAAGGIVNGDSIYCSGITAADSYSPVGQYVIVPSCTGSALSNYALKYINGTLTINQVTPVVTWAAPVAIGYGTALSATQLNATANVNGNFAYTPPAATVLGVGAQTLSVTFTPADTTDYAVVVQTASLTVTQATPAVTWAPPAAMSYGTALSGTQLNATASVNGSFAYTPPAGTVLGLGTQTLSVTFTPADTTDYAAVTQTVSLTVNPATPTITWAAPAPITYGTALSATQLNASASVNGNLVYTPPAGTVLGAGTQTLSVTFTPSDTTDYATVTQTVALTVNQATPTVTWATPTAVSYGTALSATQLNASANVNGNLVYNPPAGTVLGAGTQTLSVTFNPSDTTDYPTVTQTVSLTVNKAMPTVTWAAPAAIAYGTALSAAQLNATASVNGNLVYTPPAGTVLGAGSETLSVSFTPSDTTDYTSPVIQTVSLTVNQATPVVTWAAPAAIAYGTALSGTQLNATASVNGNFVYSPPAGTVLGIGSHTLSVTFRPSDTSDYTSPVTGTVSLTVTSLGTLVTVNYSTPSPATISYGTALVARQMKVSVTVEVKGKSTTITGDGTISFTDTTPMAGQAVTTWTATDTDVVLPAGSHAIVATWTPGASYSQYAVGYSGAQTIQVNPYAPVLTFKPTSGTQYPESFAGTNILLTTTATVTVAGSKVALGDDGSWTFTDVCTPEVAGTPCGGTLSTDGSGQLVAGSHLITASFTPADTNDYTAGAVSKTISVKQGKLSFTGTVAGPTTLVYGTGLPPALFDAVINHYDDVAKAEVPELASNVCTNGIVYTDSATGSAVNASEVLPAGSYTIDVSCTPSDANDYPSPAVAREKVKVTPFAVASLLTFQPAAMEHGTKTGAAQTTGAVNPLPIVNPNNQEVINCAWTFSPAEGTLERTAQNVTVKATCAPLTSGANADPNYTKGAVSAALNVQ